MKLLESFLEAFVTLPTDSNIKEYMNQQADILGNETFVSQMLYCYGGRSYNRFLDYGLLAIKLAALFSGNKWKAFNKVDFTQTVGSIISYLLFDDRHDMNQNVPYVLSNIINACEEEEKNKIYSALKNILIDCFNINGNGDVVYKLKIEED